LTFCSARQFIASKYPVIKKHNPDLPVLIREANGTPARVFARFGACTLAVVSLLPYVLKPEHGVEKHVELDGLSEVEVVSKVEQLLNP
jgi:NADH dehydrogenase (ubiquinone) 1 alpha subcomplex subunit 2